MNRFRFSIGSFLAVITLVAAGLGAMAAQSQWAASLAFTAFVALLCLATAVSLVRRAAHRAFWIGFAVFGWMYWFCEFTFPDSSSTAASTAASRLWISGIYVNNSSQKGGPPTGLLTGEFIRYVQDNVALNRSPGARVMAAWANDGRYFPATIVQTGSDGQIQIQWVDGGALQWTPPGQVVGDSPHLVVAGHSLMGGLFGLFGGVLAAWVAGSRQTARASGARPA
jgi:hypothetical protein